MNVRQWVDRGAQILLGLIFFVFGLNGFFHFLPMPEMSPEAGSFLGALAGTGYFFPVLKLVETVSGALLLVNRFVPLALVLLAPVVVQIFLFHAFLDPAGLPLAIVIVILEAYLGFFVYRRSFDGVLRATP
ncbi:MAG: DoxX family protein [Acidobacteria bacterium]|nr:MAG: DoxX family protein [Acidobacteriota bacterium]